MNGDTITRAICESLDIRVYTVVSLDTVREITTIHGTTPNATVALGRAINATALLSAALKPGSHQNISLRISGNGPIKEIIVQADALGNIRGYVTNPKVDVTQDIGKISFSKAIGSGFLTVTKDLGLKEPYKSIIPLQTGEIANDLAYYLTVSEQIPSALILGLTINSDAIIESSGGILIQTFPNTDERVIATIEDNIKSIKKPLGEALKLGNDIHTFASGLVDNQPVHIVDSYQIRSTCRCSKEMLASVLLNIHTNDIDTMIKEDHGAEIICSFCEKKYHFSENELQAIVNKKLLH